jgi:hypothetical protein
MSAPTSPANGSDSGTFGTEELCTWPVGPGVSRFQTRSPEFARKFRDRAGAKLIGWSVVGDYLRIYDEEIEPWRARRLVIRFLKRPNGAFSTQISPPSLPKVTTSVTTADGAVAR